MKYGAGALTNCECSSPVLLADLLLAAVGVSGSVTPTVFMWLTNWPGPASTR